ncbi:unnamed protein product, partial [Protopolystoma xenopodis]
MQVLESHFENTDTDTRFVCFRRWVSPSTQFENPTSPNSAPSEDGQRWWDYRSQNDSLVGVTIDEVAKGHDGQSWRLGECLWRALLTRGLGAQAELEPAVQLGRDDVLGRGATFECDQLEAITPRLSRGYLLIL